MHLMLDLETLDTAPTSLVLSVGAVFFTNDKLIEERLFKISIQNQLARGRTLSEDTLRWWFSQKPEAQAIFKPKGFGEESDPDLGTFVELFGDWSDEVFASHGLNWKGVNVWGNGAYFDVIIMEDIYRMAGVSIPWRFWNIICYRTFEKMTKCKKLVERAGVKHDALDDARFQAQTVIEYYKRKKRGKQKHDK